MAHLAQSSKRRRLDQAASTLSKPFKSPLRTPVQKVEQTANPSPLRLSSQINPEGRAETTDETAEHHPKEEIKGTGEAPKRTPTTPPIKAAQQTTPLVSLRKRKSFASLPNSISSDLAVAALQKQHAVLQARLSSLRAELDTTQQALRIESSSRDEELEALILKWRAASQDAAEELFVSARDKVFRMGGVRAWKERAKKSRERWDDREDTLEDWGHNLDEDERERRKAEMLDSLDLDIDSRVERDKEKEDEDDEDDEEEEEEEEESFTMDMMLKNMNIDLGTIGFDKVNQRWIKD
ncbi:DNA repair protein Dds20/Sfr1, putative [Paecilomyces variotii No. 5]|uniref:DNA repair protein Dds20/Sfr1, putative n=1 Tax=Byssochlamys spectabilis (strain No. 5 / NBRC 109023) TaxID=1356009 RepID=V5G2V1_BYSSN|nr:DNA repair protein Dds20/Sfr1, putative [Paecilomyces variotii No. 5]